jgi:hypothetical protein
MDNTRPVTDAKQQKIKIKKDVITSSMSTIVDRTCYVFFMACSKVNFHVLTQKKKGCLFCRRNYQRFLYRGTKPGTGIHGPKYSQILCQNLSNADESTHSLLNYHFIDPLHNSNMLRPLEGQLEGV